MCKKIIFTILFIGIFSFSLFATDFLLNGSEISDSDMLKTEELESVFDDKSAGKKDIIREKTDLLRKKGIIQQNIHWVEYVETAFALCINKFGETIVQIHNTLFGVSKGGNQSLKDRLSGYSSGGIFSWFLTLFIIIQCFIFAIKVVKRDNFQYSDLTGFGIKIAVVLIVFFFIPFFPKVIINIVFTAAEKICGINTGELGFLTPMTGLSFLGTTGGKTVISTLIASFAEASVGVDFGLSAELTLSGHALYIVFLLLFSICFAGIFVSFLNCIHIFLNAVYFFVSNISLVIILPSVVFSGFSGSKTTITNILKEYFFKGTELFTSGVIVLMGVKVTENIGLSDVKSIPLCFGLLIGLPVLERILLKEIHIIVKSFQENETLIQRFGIMKAIL